jgi:hypothetical protein
MPDEVTGINKSFNQQLQYQITNKFCRWYFTFLYSPVPLILTESIYSHSTSKTRYHQSMCGLSYRKEKMVVTSQSSATNR